MENNSFIFSFKLALIFGTFFLIYRYKPAWKNLAYFLVVIIGIRFILFGQFNSWMLYSNQLGVDDIGWRQVNVIDFEKRKHSHSNQRVKFLAVGSSQTQMVYTPYTNIYKDVRLFYLSGMGPLDLYLYRKYIVSQNAEYVLLYLSEFDMAKEPNLDSAKIAPQQGLDLIKIFPKMLEISKQTHSETALKEMIVGEFLPEYKYSFVFKGLRDKYMKKNRSLGVKSLLLSLKPDKNELESNLEDVVQNMDQQWIEYNNYFLAEFLSYCKRKSLKVIIVEGQYNPLAYTEKTLKLNHTTRNELQNLKKNFDNVVFIPRSKVKQFTAEDYSDATHVKSQPAFMFVNKLVTSLKPGQ